MPIKPENKKRYPKNWKDIRAAILERMCHTPTRWTVGVLHGKENHSIMVESRVCGENMLPCAPWPYDGEGARSCKARLGSFFFENKDYYKS